MLFFTPWKLHKFFAFLVFSGGIKWEFFVQWDHPFLANVPILYYRKTPQNQRFSGVFSSIKWKHWPEMDETIKLISNTTQFKFKI